MLLNQLNCKFCYHPKKFGCPEYKMGKENKHGLIVLYPDLPCYDDLEAYNEQKKYKENNNE